MYRLVLALTVAPLAAPIVFFLGFRVAGDESELSLWGFFLLFGIPAYFVAGILGLPLAVAFRALSVRSFWLHVAAGFILGGAAGHAADWLFYLGQADWEFVFVSWVAGAASLAAYWVFDRLLARIERHDEVLYGQ